LKYLLDTHVLLWALADDPRLTKDQAEAIGQGTLFLSAASVWEIAIKRASGKLDVPDHLLATAQGAGCRALPISWAHAEAAAALPRHHADPFDRMLIAQARLEGLVLLSSDARFSAYEVERIA
jgi:PIN domain nuclease of toxin-antitoxin system